MPSYDEDCLLVADRAHPLPAVGGEGRVGVGPAAGVGIELLDGAKAGAAGRAAA